MQFEEKKWWRIYSVIAFPPMHQFQLYILHIFISVVLLSVCWEYHTVSISTTVEWGKLDHSHKKWNSITFLFSFCIDLYNHVCFSLLAKVQCSLEDFGANHLSAKARCLHCIVVDEEWKCLKQHLQNGAIKLLMKIEHGYRLLLLFLEYVHHRPSAANLHRTVYTSEICFKSNSTI